jgi:hypothetical protein
MNTLFTLCASLFQSFGLVFVVWIAFVGVMSGPRAVERIFDNIFSTLIKQAPKMLRAVHKLIEELAKAIVHLLPVKYQYSYLEVLVQFALGLIAFWLFIHC